MARYYAKKDRPSQSRRDTTCYHKCGDGTICRYRCNFDLPNLMCCRGDGFRDFRGDKKYSNFMGTGVSTWKVIWWGVGALVVLAVVGKGVKIYKEVKS
tara:strand:- start:969 stop:1262 length:294 start_codon:yes stop_codon:yes gene_type:complete